MIDDELDGHDDYNGNVGDDLVGEAGGVMAVGWDSVSADAGFSGCFFSLLFWLAALKGEACLDDEAVVVAQASVSADSAFISSSLLEVFFLQIHKED